MELSIFAQNLYKNDVFLSLKIVLFSANSAEPDEMLPYVAFHLGYHCLPVSRMKRDKL